MMSWPDYVFKQALLSLRNDMGKQVNPPNTMNIYKLQELSPKTWATYKNTAHKLVLQKWIHSAKSI